jgi:hypothetical protein
MREKIKEEKLGGINFLRIIKIKRDSSVKKWQNWWKNMEFFR